jgi:enoyl-CoA hydratase
VQRKFPKFIKKNLIPSYNFTLCCETQLERFPRARHFLYMSNVKVFKSASKKVWTLVINRPRSRNAVDRETALALHRAFVSFEKDQNSKCAVLYGENGTFCAGADLKAFDNVLSPPSSKTSNGRINFDIGPMGPTRLSLSKPVIAAVEGHAV